MRNEWAVLFILFCGVVGCLILISTERYERRMEEHNRNMDELYAQHSLKTNVHTHPEPEEWLDPFVLPSTDGWTAPASNRTQGDT